MYRSNPVLMSLVTILRIPFIWGFIGLVIGAILGANDLAIWLVAILLISFLVFMKFSGPAKDDGEGSLFAGGSAIMLAWIVGFIIRGVLL
ncbi:MAG: hypothetical protein FI713_09945 [SAR202 cluster bacterium]|nr:hypothetical protein [Chloroflexota bacterium]MQG04028.1 hypothetical protein [SAR202 cluster bacterium]HAE33360.1 hypothetical protein [Dehalococcoidia bacterium]